MKNKKFKTALMFLAAMLAVAGAFAGDYAGEFMSEGTGARSLAMGGAFVSIADDASGPSWNPAGIARLDKVIVNSIKTVKRQDVEAEYGFLGAAFSAGQAGVFCAGYVKQSYGKVIVTDNDGERAGAEKEVSDSLAMLTYARPVSGFLSLGASLKMLSGAYPTQSGGVGYNGFGADIGVSLNPGSIDPALKGLNAGIALQDPFTKVSWSGSGEYAGGNENVSANVKAGLSYDMQFDFLRAISSGFLLAADIDTSYSGQYHFGAEYTFNNMASIRAGVKGFINPVGDVIRQEPALSFGAGAKISFITLDYAFVNNEMEPVQYVSVSGMF